MVERCGSNRIHRGHYVNNDWWCAGRDKELQPLPEFDNVVVPETQPYICAECGQQHQAELVGQVPLGDMKIQLQYRAVPCPNKELHVVDGGPVVREDKDVPQVPHG